MTSSARPDSRNLADRFEQVVDADPGRPALIVEDDDDEGVSYGQLDQRANQAAKLLRVRSVGPGDPIGVTLGPGRQSIETMLGALKARAVPFAIERDLSAQALEEQFAETKAVGLFLVRDDTQRLTDAVVRLPLLNFFVVVDDGSERDISVPNAVFYEEALRSYEPEQDWGRRADDDLYGRVTFDADGRPVARLLIHAEIDDRSGGSGGSSGSGTSALDPALADLLAGRTVAIPHS